MRAATALFVLFGTAVILSLTACDDSTPNDPVTTNASARRQIIDHLQQTVDALPWSATLSQTFPGRQGRFRPSPLPCDFDSANTEQPYAWTYQLWLLLPAGTTQSAALTAVGDVWRGRRYNVETVDGTHDAVRARTRDGYRLAAASGPVGVVVSAQSPCFPRSQLDETMSWPDGFAGSS